MDRFTRLFMELDATTKTTCKLQALGDYFQDADEADALWALWLLSGNTLRRAVTSTQLKDWASETAGLPRWLFDEGYIRVGDLAETVSLVVPQTKPAVADGSAAKQDVGPAAILAAEYPDEPLAAWMQAIAALPGLSEPERKAYIVGCWQSLGQTQKFIFTKLITGGFRVGASRALVVRAMAAAFGLDTPALFHALTGNWNPGDTTLAQLAERQGTAIHPYPFFLASPIGDYTQLGARGDWQFEWKWDGIRGQVVRRGDDTALWSRGEDLVSQQFPELMMMAEQLPPGTVLDGEILPWKNGVLPFAVLQTRLGRKVVSKNILETAPVAFMAYDLLELQGRDLRETPLEERRQLLETVVADLGQPALQVSPLVHADSWEALQIIQKEARVQKAEGLMAKRRSSPYRVGRVRGDWWKWKVDPFSVDAVMINAQRGHGRRSAVYSDYTFAVRSGDQLVPFAKAYSGLTDAEINKVDAFVKRHTLEKFGPVRSVTPELVFEIGFEGIAASKRHKSGVAVRFPRILRMRPDKPVAEIDTIESLQKLLEDVS